MKGFVAFACLGSVGALLASQAHADCGFNTPARAKSVKTSLVRAHAPCSGSHTFPSPNTASSAGVPACAPSTPITDADVGECLPSDCTFSTSAYSFATDGKCSVVIRQYTTDECGNGLDAPPTCFSLVASLNCQGIRDSEGKPVHSKDFVLRILARLTSNDAGPLTLVDYPLQLAVHVAGGKIADKKEVGDQYSFPLPACTQVQVFGIELLDDAGMIFATMGSGSR